MRETIAGVLILTLAGGCSDDAATGAGAASSGGGATGGHDAQGGAGAGTSSTGGGGGGVPPITCDTREPIGGYYAAIDGTPGGAGTIDAPWDIATALQSDVIEPGSTLYLRGGTYSGGFVAKLDGTAEAPVVVRSYPGEWAILDGAPSTEPTLQIYHAFTTFRDFEVLSSAPDRTVSRPSGIYVEADHIRLVNLVIHDTGTGVICNSSDSATDYAPGLEVYGNILFDNGWQEADRGHGHHLYLQNHYDSKKIRHNILMYAFGFGVHAYSETDSNWTQGYDIEQNVWFGNGAPYQGPDSKLYDGCLVGHNETHPAARVRLEGNMGWAPNGDRDVRLGWGAPNEDATLTGNYLVGSTIFQPSWASVTMDGNTFIGSVEGLDTSAYPDNTYLSTAPSETVPFVIPNEEQPGRAMVVVYNWAGADSVDVDLASALAPGSHYEIRRAQNYLAGPIASGDYDGSPVALPMGHNEVTQPIGLPDAIDPTELPGKAFDVFIVDGC